MNRRLLDRARELGARESGPAVVVTSRTDGSFQATVVNAGVLRHPVTGELVVGFVTRGHAGKLANLRVRPQMTIMFRSGWEWVAVEGTAELAGPNDLLEGMQSRDIPLLLDRSDDPFAVARLATGWVRLNPNQHFVGATFFASHACVAELHDLDRATRHVHLGEMAEVAAAVMNAFGPRKLNYELLGNGCPHLHWWLTPRYASDPRPIGPIWEDLDFLRAHWTDGARPTDDERASRRRQLLNGLRERSVAIEWECR